MPSRKQCSGREQTSLRQIQKFSFGLKTSLKVRESIKLSGSASEITEKSQSIDVDLDILLQRNSLPLDISILFIKEIFEKESRFKHFLKLNYGADIIEELLPKFKLLTLGPQANIS